MTERASLGAVEKALEVLACFTPEAPELGVSQISRDLGLGISTVHRLLTTMVRSGYVLRDPVTQRYRLGSRIVQLAAAAVENDDLKVFARPVLTKLRDLTGETARLHVLFSQQRVCAVEVETLHDIRASGGVGKTYRLTSGAASKAILAFQPDEAVALILDEVDAAKRTKIQMELARVRKQRFAMSVEENARGAASLAAPIRDRSSHVVAALCVTGPTTRWGPRDMLKFAGDIVRLADELSVQLGKPK